VKIAQVVFTCQRVAKSLKELVWTHVLTAGTLAMTLFVFGGFLIVQENLQGLLKGWGRQIEIFAYLKEGLSAADYQALVAEVRSYPEIESVRYVSKERAWEEFKKSLGSQSGLLDGLDRDILPSSLEVTLRPEYREHSSVESLATRLKNLRGVSEVEFPQEWVEKLNFLVWGVQWAKWIVGALLFVATFLIVGNTAKLAILARKDEIEIMRLVGAGTGLVRAPFIIEGMMQGLAGAAFALLLLGAFFAFIEFQLGPALRFYLAEEELRFLNGQGAALLLALGWVLGTSGSLFSVRRYLHP
jgi:cell division transport system permease protein